MFHSGSFTFSLVHTCTLLSKANTGKHLLEMTLIGNRWREEQTSERLRQLSYIITSHPRPDRVLCLIRYNLFVRLFNGDEVKKPT